MTRFCGQEQNTDRTNLPLPPANARVTPYKIFAFTLVIKENREIAAETGFSKPTVGLWRKRFAIKRIRRGSFRSVQELILAITDYIATHNKNPETFKWTAKAGTILEKVERARNILNQSMSA